MIYKVSFVVKRCGKQQRLSGFIPAKNAKEAIAAARAAWSEPCHQFQFAAEKAPDVQPDAVPAEPLFTVTCEWAR